MVFLFEYLYTYLNDWDIFDFNFNPFLFIEKIIYIHALNNRIDIKDI